jgi:peptidoglycan-associated lipoprotein
MKKYFVLLPALLILLSAGCAKKYAKPAQKPSEPAEQVKEEVLTPEKAVQPEEGISYAKEEEISESRLSPEEKAKAVLQDVLFDYDKYDIRPDARPVLDSVASLLNEEPQLNVVVEGHCDERGTNEYNLALGERRARSVKDYLVSLGVSPGRLITITYGEEKPVCTEKSETCWQQNRRAHFVVVKPGY